MVTSLECRDCESIVFYYSLSIDKKKLCLLFRVVIALIMARQESALY